MYRFVEEVGDDVYHAKTVPASQALVYEHKDSQRAWVTYRKDGLPESHGCVPKDTIKDTVKERPLNVVGWYEVHVPEGTIVSLAEINLQ